MKYITRSLLFILPIYIAFASACDKDVTDINFTYYAYEKFLDTLSKQPDIIIVPLCQFDSVSYPDKIVVGLRHDIDSDIVGATEMAEIENNYGFKATYYVLHTASYYLANEKNKAIHNENVINPLLNIQNMYNHEVGWHNDLVTIQVIYNIDAVSFFTNELNWLRKNGLKIYGSASHGSDYCYTYGYHNQYFFSDFDDNVYYDYPNNLFIQKDGKKISIPKAYMKDFNLTYEAYHINYNQYYSDCSFPNGNRWHPGMINYNDWKAGDRVIILTHPTHWSNK